MRERPRQWNLAVMLTRLLLIGSTLIPNHTLAFVFPKTPSSRQTHSSYLRPLSVASSQWSRPRHARIRPLFSSNDNPHESSASSKRLQDCICLVTGASRGIGKGIAVELGKQGAIVYVTGTSSTDSQKSNSSNAPYTATPDTAGPGTIEETAEEITQAGGMGIAVYCNHAVDADVQACVDQIQQDRGRLDILVNNAFRLPKGGVEKLYGNFWEQGSEVWDALHTVGLRSHFAATCKAMPLLLESQEQMKTSKPNALSRPLIVMIGSFGGLTYTFNVPYGVGKAGVDRLAKDMAVELTPHDICVMSLWPGVVTTERTEIAVETGDWDEYVGIPLDNAESPNFTGKAVVEVACDDNNMAKTGTYQVVAELAKEYDFTDINGKQPPSIRSLQFLLPAYAFDDEMRTKVPDWLIPDWRLPFWVMAQGRPPKPDE